MTHEPSALRHLFVRAAAGAGAVLAMAAAPAVQAAYPERPIQVVISFPPGGGTDVLGRAIGSELSKHLGQAVVVDNRPGAGGAIGLNTSAKAPADGYTLHLSALTNQAIAASIYPSLQTDLRTDFEPVAGVGSTPHVLVVPASLDGVSSVPELVDYLKAKPGQYNFASQGVGTLSHLESELFLQKTGAEATHIPYKGSSQALPDVVNGISVMMFDSISGSMPLAQSGRLKVLAIASTQRSQLYPDVPTVSESGVEGFEADNWFGFFAPKGTPQEVLDTLNVALKKTLETPALIETLGQQGAELRYMPPEELRTLTEREYELWAEAVESAAIPPQ